MNILFIPNIAKNKKDNRLSSMIELCKKYKTNINHIVLYPSKKNNIKKVLDIINKNNIKLIMCNYGEDYLNDIGLPIIILERLDSCTLTNKNRKYLNCENVVAIFKEYVCSDMSEYSTKHIQNRLHYTNLVKMKDARYASIASDDDNHEINSKYSKIIPVSWNLYQYSFVCNKTMENAKNSVIPDIKDIDVFFVCNPHRDHEILYEHRISGQKTLIDDERMSKYNILTNYIDNRNVYKKMVMRSKICVCPYGLGSRIALDQLSILSGSIAIKPNMDHVNLVPNVYKEGYYEIVEANWTDLIDKILDILENWDSKYKKLAIERRNEVIKKYDEQFYLTKYVEAIRNVVAQNEL